MRPYAKYAAAPDGSVLMTFSDGHPGSFKSSLYFAALQGRPLPARRRARRRHDWPICRSASTSSTASTPTAARAGRAWPMDIAADADGAPVVAYTALRGVADTFRYARWDGDALARRTRSRPPGETLFSYHNAGVTLDHADPSRVVLSRTIDGQNEIEVRRTADHGATWSGDPAHAWLARRSTSAR